MKKEDLLSLIKSPFEFDINSLKSLQEVIELYPYFQPAYALRLKLLKHFGSFQYNKFLKETASRTQDRRVLFEFITSKEFSQLEIANRIDLLIKHDKENEALEINEELVNQINDPELFVEKEQSPKESKGQPLEFDSSEQRSFKEWMKLTQLQPLEEKKEETQERFKENPQFQVIDEFIKNNPKIVPTKSYESSERIKPKHEPSTSLMTETLARVYVEQKRYDKAIQAFKILILNNPEKSSFFADQIQEIERLKENKL
jgi:tetratricopeptide (TPR) repeat protein